ncbi:MAG TPA: GNAT family N-acetyltransferase [Candidatus Saccharimonadales bacterium]|nr:GNAT family N-acetyltransferase [Candidatus Saccharimonadales bacterium]
MPRIRIRKPTPRDVPTLGRISYDAFPSREFPIAARETLIADHPTTDLKDRLLLELDGRPAGALMMIPFHVWLAGARFQMGGIAGVAVSPEARRAGVAQALMQEALRAMRARGDSLSMLYPFRHDFYRRYGYGLVGERHIFDLPPAALPQYEARRQVRALRREEYPRVHECYARLMKSQNSWLERTRKMWARRLKDAETRVLGVEREGEEDGELAGYCVCEHRTWDGRPCLEVTDYAAESESALRAILGMLSALRDQLWMVRIFAAPDEHFAARLVEPQEPIRSDMALMAGFSSAGRLGYGYMARVLDLPAALATRRYEPCEPLVAAITVRDASLSGGAARAVLSLGPAGGAPAKTLPLRRGEALRANLDLPVDLFSQCFWGYLPWTAAAREELFIRRGDDVLAELDRAFRVPLPNSRDFF